MGRAIELGFTHYCGRRRKDGVFIVRRETAKKRLVAKLQAIKTELKRRRHEPVASVGAGFRRSVRATTNTTLFPETWIGFFSSGGGCVGCGIACYRGAASAAGSPWNGLTGS